MTTSLSPSVSTVHIAHGAHHLDLMFEHVDDPPSVRAARDAEIRAIRQWVAAHADARAHEQPNSSHTSAL